MEQKIIEIGPELKGIIERYMTWAEKQCSSTAATVAYCNSIGQIFRGVTAERKE